MTKTEQARGSNFRMETTWLRTRWSEARSSFRIPASVCWWSIPESLVAILLSFSMTPTKLSEGNLRV